MISMLRRRHVSDGLQDAKVVRDLGIIVTEVDLGTIVRPTEPNYALLSRATSTIKKFLQRIHTRDKQVTPAASGSNPPGNPELGGMDPSALWPQLEPWDFEIDFWNNLAEHPSMFDSVSVHQHW